MKKDTKKLVAEVDTLKQEIDVYKSTIDGLIKEISSLNATMEAMADRQNHPIKAIAKGIGENLTQTKDACERTYKRAIGYLKSAKENAEAEVIKEDDVAVRDTLHDYYKKEVSTSKGLFQRIKDNLGETKEFVKNIPSKLKETKDNAKDTIFDIKDKFWVKSGLANHELKNIRDDIRKAQDKIFNISNFDKSMFDVKQGLTNAFRSLQGRSPMSTEYVMSKANKDRIKELSEIIAILKQQEKLVSDRIALINAKQEKGQEAELDSSTPEMEFEK